MYSHSKDIKIFSANSNKPLAESICQRLGLPMGDSEVKTFAEAPSILLIASVTALTQ